MYVDCMYLATHNMHLLKSLSYSLHKVLLVMLKGSNSCILTGPNALINTSRTSNQPLNDSTSNSVKSASPMLSKLKRLGFALKSLI